MTTAVVVRGARHHRDVWLRFRVRIERDRQLRIDLPGITERAAQCLHHAANRRRMPAALRFADDQEPIEQLDAFARLKDTEFDQAVVLYPGPSPRFDLRVDD